MADALAEEMGMGRRAVPGVGQDGDRRQTGSQSRESLAGSFGRSRPAKARGISGDTVKSAGADETGGSGRSSEEGKDSTTFPERRTCGVSGVARGEDSSGLPARAICRRHQGVGYSWSARRAEANHARPERMLGAA